MAGDPQPSNSDMKTTTNNNGTEKFKAPDGWKGVKYPNPPDLHNPDPATLREQWAFAIKQYSKWYSHAWGTAIVAGVSFFALGWFIKGGNPLLSKTSDDDHKQKSSTGVRKAIEAKLQETCKTAALLFRKPPETRKLILEMHHNLKLGPCSMSIQKV